LSQPKSCVYGLPVAGSVFWNSASSVSGVALVRYQEDGGIRDVRVPADEVWRFQFPPGVAHAFKNTGERTFLIVSFNTELHDPGAPDVERVELIAS